MIIDLKNKIALVTGGATGIGRGIAKALSDSNATVIITSRNKKDINQTLKSLNKKCQDNSNNIFVLQIRHEFKD